MAPLRGMGGYGYNGIGWLTSVTSPRGNVTPANPTAFTTTVDHNAFGDVTTVTDPLGHMTTRHYDADRNLDRVTNGRNKPAQYDYDAADELIKLTRPDGSTVKREYRGDGAVTAFVDGANQRTSFTYDARGRTSGITDPLHHTATAGFDPADRLLYIDDPGVRSAYYTYDQADQLKGIFYTGYASLSASIKTGWNLLDPWAMSPGGSLSSLVDDLNTALGADTAVKATAVYQNGRFQLYVPGYSEDIDYQPSQGVFVLSTASGTWSSQNATNSTPSTSPLTPGWNLLAVPVPSSGINAGALSSQLAPACGLQEIAVYQNGSYKTYFPGKSADFHIPATSGMWVLCSRTAYWTLQTDDPNITNITYDNDGRRIAMNDGTGTSSWSYDSLGRLTQSRDGAGSVVSYGYDLGNNLTSITYPGNHAVTRGFDAAGRLHTVADWLGHTSTFDYDADGNLTTQTLPAATGVVDTFGYDNADRLMNIAAARAGTTLASFTYGRNEDNLLTSSQATGVTQPAETYTYTALDQLQGVNSASYGYDAADNLTQLPSGATLQYNAARQLTGMTQGPTTTQYAYDGVGSRISQTPTGGSAVTYAYDSARNLTDYNSVASYIYNGDGLRMSKTVGGATQAFVWDAAEALPLLLQDGATSYVYGPNGLPLEQIASNGSVLYYHHDQLGSTRLLTDSVGTVAATYTYDAFGKQTAKTGSISNPFGYAGAYTDAESGLQYLRNRYYDPNTGQFLTVDPLVRQTLTPYSYAQNSPLNFVDPAGLDWWNPLTWFDSPSQAEQAAQDAKQINSDRKSLQQAVDNIENNARKVADAYEAAKDGKLLEFGTECAREKALKDAQSQLGARNEYKNLMDEQDANKEATKSLWDKVKSLWDGSSDALAGQTGSNSPSTSQNSSGTPPSSRPQLREFQAP